MFFSLENDVLLRKTFKCKIWFFQKKFVQKMFFVEIKILEFDCFFFFFLTTHYVAPRPDTTRRRKRFV
jgi:hypothetical protein